MLQRALPFVCILLVSQVGCSVPGPKGDVRTVTSASAPASKPSPGSAATSASQAAAATTAMRAAIENINGGADETPPSEFPPVNLTPLSQFEDQWDKKRASGHDFAGSYTRLVVSSVLYANESAKKTATTKASDARKKADTAGKFESSADGGAQTDDVPSILPYKPRWWLVRAIVGREFAVNLSAKINVGSYETTVPLATIGHQSNSEGEIWTREVHHDKVNFPLFLVKEDGAASTPVIKLTVQGSKAYSSRGAGAALQVALGVARATAQPLSVVTKLSEQSTKDGARAVDDAISKLFTSGITEEHWSDRDLRYWRMGDKDGVQGAKVKFFVPEDETSWDSKLKRVGEWIVSFDFPRPSIFSDWRMCGSAKLPRCKTSRAAAEIAVYEGLNPSQVLNYELVRTNQGLATIRAYLAQQEWYVAAQVPLSKDPKTAKDAASTLCRQVRNEIVGLGLNGFDADIVVWAIWKGMPLPPEGKSAFTDSTDCNDSIALIEEHHLGQN